MPVLPGKDPEAAGAAPRLKAPSGAEEKQLTPIEMLREAFGKLFDAGSVEQELEVWIELLAIEDNPAISRYVVRATELLAQRQLLRAQLTHVFNLIGETLEHGRSAPGGGRAEGKEVAALEEPQEELMRLAAVQRRLDIHRERLAKELAEAAQYRLRQQQENIHPPDKSSGDDEDDEAELDDEIAWHAAGMAIQEVADVYDRVGTKMEQLKSVLEGGAHHGVG